MSANPNGPYTFKVLASSGAVTAVGVGGYVKAFGLTVTTNASSCQLVDGATGGTVGPELKIDGSIANWANSSKESGDIGPLRFDTDIFLNIVGAGAEGWVIFNQDAE